jgi:hypothetical protein
MIEGCGEFIGGLIIVLFPKKIKNIAVIYTLNGLLFLGLMVLVHFGFENGTL